MNPLRTLCLMACLLAAVCAAPNQQDGSLSSSNKLKPSEWMTTSQLESLPSVNEVSLEKLENMSVQEGAQLIRKLYHLSQINHDLTPSFVPSPSNVPVYIAKANGQKITVNLNTLVETAKQQQNFGEQEVTIFITGLPQNTQTVSKATRALVQAYMQRYKGKVQWQKNNVDYDYANKDRTSSEEDYTNTNTQNQNYSWGDLIVIDLGSVLTNFKRWALLDVEQTGAMVGNVLLDLTKEVDVPEETIHIVAQGMSAHVAGAAGRQYTRMSGRQVRRITALDPSKILARDPQVITGLARGDAEFVDAIHTSAYGLGTPNRVGDIDFYPNGPSASVPGANNVVEASMRATRFYAETVRPGNERNFPAVAANSLQQYLSKNGNGQRAYMGIDTDFDQEGDYILEVNAKSPFGKKAPAQRQNNYHGVHQSFKKQ